MGCSGEERSGDARFLLGIQGEGKTDLRRKIMNSTLDTSLVFIQQTNPEFRKVWARDVDLGQNNHWWMRAEAQGQASAGHDAMLWVKIST